MALNLTARNERLARLAQTIGARHGLSCAFFNANEGSYDPDLGAPVGTFSTSCPGRDLSPTTQRFEAARMEFERARSPVEAGVAGDPRAVLTPRPPLPVSPIPPAYPVYPAPLVPSGPVVPAAPAYVPPPALAIPQAEPSPWEPVPMAKPAPPRPAVPAIDRGWTMHEMWIDISDTAWYPGRGADFIPMSDVLVYGAGSGVVADTPGRSLPQLLQSVRERMFEALMEGVERVNVLEPRETGEASSIKAHALDRVDASLREGTDAIRGGRWNVSSDVLSNANQRLLVFRDGLAEFLQRASVGGPLVRSDLHSFVDSGRPFESSYLGAPESLVFAAIGDQELEAEVLGRAGYLLASTEDPRLLSLRELSTSIETTAFIGGPPDLGRLVAYSETARIPYGTLDLQTGRIRFRERKTVSGTRLLEAGLPPFAVDFEVAGVAARRPADGHDDAGCSVLTLGTAVLPNQLPLGLAGTSVQVFTPS